jgi:ribosome-associated translation inhibitor RaiA
MRNARAPLAGRIPRAAKKRLNRHAASDIPAHIRAHGAPVEAEDRAYLRRKLGRKLGKFARAVERVSVRIRDVNGPRGGVDKLCAIKVALAGLPSVVVEERHASLQGAMDRAMDRAERAVRRSVKRRTTRSRTERARRSTSRS